MNTENIAHYFYGSAPAEDELMNAVFSGENTVDALKTAANQHEFLYTEKIRLWNELHMALVGCPGTEPISHEPLSQAIVGVDFVDDGQVAYTLLEDLDDIVSALNEAMKMAGIYEYRERAPHNLSGGQKQRVAIAGVVAMRPDCLILDEATAMLDPRGREQVMQTIHHLNKNMGITVVSITHYMEEAAQADRVLVMSKGNVVMEGTPKEVFSQTEKVRALRLDVPQAAELRDELVKAGIPMPEGIIDTGACAQALYELLK